MPVTQTTLQHWKNQLANNQQLLNSKANRFRWLRALYVRIYQFLISQYGTKPESTNTDVEQETAAAVSHMPFEDLTLDHRGLQPRSTQSLRYVLEQIHTHQAGGNLPTVDSTHTTVDSKFEGNPWIIVATGKELLIPECEQVLREQGIEFRRRGYGRKRILEVSFEQRNAAFNALLKSGKPLRRTKQQRIAELKRQYQWMGEAALGACLVAAIIVSLLAFARTYWSQ